jgi:pyridoxine/pyridoxamine 5'-phosphate oxidase
MKEKLADIRKQYSKQVLLEDMIPQNPIDLFQSWLEMAVQFV